MKWLKRIFSGPSKKQSDPSETAQGSSGEQPNNGPATSWLSPDDPENPFPVPIVSLMGNLELQSMSQDQEAATMAISWRPGQQRRISPDRSGDGIACDLRYPIDGVLPDGMLFIPSAMEDKWVIALRDETVIFARSWTGETEITADATVENSELCLRRIYRHDVVSSFGDVATVVDWIVRSHAMQERLPLPVDQETAKMLAEFPLMAMSIFGHRLFCAGVGYRMPPTETYLVSDGDMAAAVHANDLAKVRQLASEEAWLSRTSVVGSPPLLLASQLGHTDLCTLILELGADIEARNNHGETALHMGVVSKAGSEHVAMLLDAGAKLNAENCDGFTAVHAAVEVDDADMVRFLAQRGADLEAETQKGYRPIHIAAGLGHRDSAEALIELGVDIQAECEGNNPVQIAISEGNHEFARWFESRQRSS